MSIEKIKDGYSRLTQLVHRLTEIESDIASITHRIEGLEVEGDTASPELIRAYDKRRHLYRERADKAAERVRIEGEIHVAAIEVSV